MTKATLLVVYKGTEYIGQIVNDMMLLYNSYNGEYVKEVECKEVIVLRCMEGKI